MRTALALFVCLVMPFGLVFGDDVQPSDEPAEAPPGDTLSADWSGRLELGVTGRFDTDGIGGRGLASATRTGPNGKLMLGLRGVFAGTSGEDALDEAVVWQEYDRDISDRWFWFERLDLEYDRFEDLNLRSTLSGGVGYTLFQSHRSEFNIRGALAYEHEEFESDSDDSFLVAGGWDSYFEFCRWFRYTSRFTFFLEPADLCGWRVDSENAGEIPLRQDSGWKFRFGLHTEYDGDPQSGNEERDFSYFASIVYDWD